CWSGKISEVRPLTLLEHARKIMFAILVDRLTGIFMRHNIIRGPNFSVLKGKMTKNPIQILNSVMEDARKFNKEIPERIGDHCKWIAANKTNTVNTAYGPTEKYHPQCGLDQGGVEYPAFWMIAYEGLGYPIMRRAALAEHHRLPPIQIKTPDMPLLIAALAFMDDTTWAVPSQQNLQDIVNIAISFFEFNSIEVNPKKTELLVINSDLPEKTIQLGDDTIKALAPTAAARMLSVWLLCG
ncbi:hypothetical protein BGZ98_001648, partial [Dissophora globulifera]